MQRGLDVTAVFLGQPVPEILEPDPFPHLLSPLEFQPAAVVQAAGQNKHFKFLPHWLSHGNLLHVELKFY
jgi:hypothetical protein